MTSTEGSWQIGAGKWKGKKLPIPPKTTTRPTKSIIRASLFDTIGRMVIGADFVELFGGSGSVGIEALSRGAAHAWFVERDAAAKEVLLGNLRRVGTADYTLLEGDAFEKITFIEAALCRSGKKALLYCDPPFEIREGMEGIYNRLYARLEELDPACIALIALEYESRVSAPEAIGRFALMRSRRFGNSTLSLYISE